MYTHRQIPFRCHTQLPDEHLFLLRQIEIFDPSVESNFAYRRRYLVERAEQGGLPARRPLFDILWMIAKRRDNLGIGCHLNHF